MYEEHYLIPRTKNAANVRRAHPCVWVKPLTIRAQQSRLVRWLTQVEVGATLRIGPHLVLFSTVHSAVVTETVARLTAAFTLKSKIIEEVIGKLAVY